MSRDSMLWKLDEKIWFGGKPTLVEQKNKVGSVINAAHALKAPYWGDLKKLPWQVWYFRLALPDGCKADKNHINALETILDAIDKAGKYPLLCHCRLGGHRGPGTAVFAYWHLNGRNEEALKYAVDKAVSERPAFANNKTAEYWNSLLNYMKEQS